MSNMSNQQANFEFGKLPVGEVSCGIPPAIAGGQDAPDAEQSQGGVFAVTCNQKVIFSQSVDITNLPRMKPCVPHYDPTPADDDE